MSDFCQEPSAVVIVDVWADSTISVLEPLLEFIQRDFVKCIVVASYSDWNHHGTRAVPIEWPIWHNSRQIFNPDLNPNVPDYTGRSWRSFEHAQNPTPPADHLMNQFVKLDRSFTKPALLKKLDLLDTPSYAAWEPHQLTYLLNSHHPEIRNIYLCGGAFEQCLYDRPLGIKSLQNEIRQGVFKNIQRMLIPTQCVYVSGGGLLSAELKTSTKLLNPNWGYLPDQQLLIPQVLPNRESHVSLAVSESVARL
jgi:hypothetical protein